MKKMIAKILVLTLLMFYPSLYFVSATEYKDDIAVKNVNEQVTDTYVTDTNIEMMRISITKSDTYTIVAYQYGTMNKNIKYDWMSLTCSY